MKNLEKKLNYQFKDKKLLNIALRHRSIGKNSNERLEFLGDSIVNFVIAAELYKKYPKFREGELSRIRSNLVKKETLAELAKQFNVGDYLYLGMGEKKSGGFRRTSILADAMEAIIGAIYLDSNFETCQEKILTWYGIKLNQLNQIGQKDAKTELQESIQARKLPLPEYKVVSQEGKAHRQIFHIQCTVEGLDIVAKGQGASKQEAEQEAAKNFIDQLKSSPKQK
jgi:ribonuclease-3